MFILQQSGYRNRLLPLPLPHRQPEPHVRDANNPKTPYSTEPVWTQLMPLSSHAQYILFWYIAETVPSDVEIDLNSVPNATATDPVAGSNTAQPIQPYRPPPPYPPHLSLKQRIQMEPKGYEPIRHENTGVDEEEALYSSALLPVEDAIEKLRGSVMSDVVRNGWEGITKRLKMEQGEEEKVKGSLEEERGKQKEPETST